MAQFAVLVYLPAPADPMDLSAEYLELIDSYPERAKEMGGKVLGASYFAKQRGFAYEASTTAASITGDTVSGGTLVGSTLVPAAMFVLSAPDFDTAVAAAKVHPAAQLGGIEVRPVFPEPKG